MLYLDCYEILSEVMMHRKDAIIVLAGVQIRKDINLHGGSNRCYPLIHTSYTIYCMVYISNTTVGFAHGTAKISLLKPSTHFNSG